MGAVLDDDPEQEYTSKMIIVGKKKKRIPRKLQARRRKGHLEATEVGDERYFPCNDCRYWICKEFLGLAR